jgi:hypothetical protein
MAGTIPWKDWLAGLVVDTIGGAEKMPVLDGTTAKHITTDLMATYTIAQLMAASNVAPATGDSLLVERSGARRRMTLDALSAYAVASGWSVANTASPALGTDVMLVQRSGTIVKISLSTLIALANAANLDLTGLTAGTPGASDLFLFGAGASPRKITLANLEAKLWTDFATYVNGLPAVTTTAANDRFYCIQGGTPKFVTPAEMAAFIVPNAGNVIGPLTTTPGYVPQWDAATNTLVDGLSVVTNIRSLTGGAVDTAIPTERAVRSLLGGIASLEIVAGTDIGSAIVDGDLFIIYDLSANANRKSDVSRIWAYIVSKMQAATAKTTPVNTDALTILDSADSNNLKRLTVANLWANRYANDARAINLDQFAEPDDNTNLDATTLRHGLMSKADKIKLDGIEPLADVTDAANVAAAGATMNTDTNVSANAWVIAENNMASNSATRVPTQQSVKSYVDGQLSSIDIDNLDIGNGEDIGEAIADNDLLIVANTSEGENQKCAASRIKDYAKTIKLDQFAEPDDNTNLNATPSRHGLLMKLENTGTKVLYDNGTWAEPPGASGGEANTGANLGGGQNVFKEKSGTELRFRTLVAGSGTTVTTSGDTIVVASTVTAGETNTAANVGSGQNIFKEKSGVELRFRGIASSTDNITVGTNGDNIEVGSRQPTVAFAANQTLTAAQCRGYVVYVTAAATITLPAIADGMSLTVITIGDVAVSVDPNSADRIWLDGVALDDGDKITNDSKAGDIAVLTYYSADGWHASTNGWTDGGP